MRNETLERVILKNLHRVETGLKEKSLMCAVEVEMDRYDLTTNEFEDVIRSLEDKGLVIDDFGLMELDVAKCRDLFEVIESRDCRKSTMIVSQFPVKRWWDFFKDNTYADACLSRMTSRAYRLECNGRDMRQP